MNGLTKEMETVRASSGGGGGGVGKVGGREWEGGGEGHVRSRLMMLEQRTEQQERETSTLKVNTSCYLSGSLDNTCLNCVRNLCGNHGNKPEYNAYIHTHRLRQTFYVAYIHIQLHPAVHGTIPH